MRGKKSFLTIFVLCATLIASIACASAATYNAVQVDDFTGEVVEGTKSNLVALTDGCSYNKDTDEFEFQAGDLNGTAFSANIPNGAVVQTEVKLYIPDSLSPTLYCDGEVVENASLTRITGEGAYSVSLVEDEETVSGVFTFTILGDYVGGDTYYVSIPDGFRVEEATCADTSIAYTDTDVSLQTEGEYCIVYTSDAVNKSYQLDFTVDHTAPELTFDGVVDGIAKGPVTIQGAEEDDEIYIYINKKQAAYSDTLAVVGDYSVTVTDPAGNSNSYAFTIRTYFNGTAWVFVGLVVLLLAASAGYVIIKRKKFRTN